MLDSGWSGKSQARKLHFQRRSLYFSMGSQPWWQGQSDADASEYSMTYFTATSDCRQLLCTDVVIWSDTTVPVAFWPPFLFIFTNSEMQERYLPIIRDAGMPDLVSQGTLTTHPGYSLYFTIWDRRCRQNCPFLWGELVCHIIICSLVPLIPYPNSISIHSAILAQLMVVTNRQTDTQIMLLYYYFQLLFY